MQQHLVLALGEVIEQTRLREAVGLKIVPSNRAKVALIKECVKDTDYSTCLVLLVRNLFFNLCNFEVVENAVGKHEAHQRLVVE